MAAGSGLPAMPVVQPCQPPQYQEDRQDIFTIFQSDIFCDNFKKKVEMSFPEKEAVKSKILDGLCIVANYTKLL